MRFDLETNPIPADALAARVVYQKGVYEPFKHKSHEKMSTTPLPTRDIPKGAPNFIGHKKGWLTVIGMYSGPEVGARPCGSNRRSKPQGHGWVCRCVCGNYTVRRTRSIRKKCFDACIECTSRENKRNGINIRVSKTQKEPNE